MKNKFVSSFSLFVRKPDASESSVVMLYETTILSVKEVSFANLKFKCQSYQGKIKNKTKIPWLNALNYQEILDNINSRSKKVLAVVTLQTFYLGKHDLLTVYLGKLDFLSVTDFSLGNLLRGNFIVWVFNMSRKQ